MNLSKVHKLYPQYKSRKSDRRKKEIPVEYDRRSGDERRTDNRFKLDIKLKKEIENLKKIFEKF